MVGSKAYIEKQHQNLRLELSHMLGDIRPLHKNTSYHVPLDLPPLVL